MCYDKKKKSQINNSFLLYQILHKRLLLNDELLCLQNTPLYWSMVESGLQDVGEKDVHSLAHSQSLDADLRQSISVKVMYLDVAVIFSFT